MANLIDTINSSVSKVTGQTGNNTNYGIKKRAPVVPIQTETGPMSVNTIGPVKPISTDLVKSNVIKTPTVSSAPITSNTLKPTIPIALPDATIDNSARVLSDNLVGETKIQNDTFQKGLEDVKKSYGNTDAITNLMSQISGVEASQESEANKLGKDTNKNEYDRLSKELSRDQEDTRRQIEDIQKSNPTGALRGGQLDQIANIERDAARRQSDIAFQANIAIGNYDKAVSIAKNTVDMQLAPLKANLDRLKYVQEYNKDFQNAEINALVKKEDNKIKREEDRLTESNTMILNAIRSKAPTNLIEEAKKMQANGDSATDIASTLGKYSVDPEKALDLQIKQQSLIKSINDNNATGTTINPKILNTTQFKNAQAAQNLKLTLQKAIDAVKLYGNKEKVSGTGKGILDSIKVQLRSEISTALEQGVVVPGEAAAFDSIAGQINDSYFIRNSKTLSSLNSLKNSMDGRIALQKSALTNTYNVKPEQVDLLLNVTDISDQEFTDMDALVE